MEAIIITRLIKLAYHLGQVINHCTVTNYYQFHAVATCTVITTQYYINDYDKKSLTSM